jgi:hypothetical protein
MVGGEGNAMSILAVSWRNSNNKENYREKNRRN